MLLISRSGGYRREGSVVRYSGINFSKFGTSMLQAFLNLSRIQKRLVSVLSDVVLLSFALWAPA